MAPTARRNRRQAVAAGLVAALVIAANPTAQAAPPSEARQAVRPSDARSQALVRSAAASSPTVAALLDSLETTDVIVLLQSPMARFGFAGDLRFLSATGGRRYVAVRVSAEQPPRDQIAILGHELQHAAEVAGAPEVTSGSALAGLMRGIGRRSLGGAFETDAAVEVTRQVRKEVMRAR